MTPGFKQRVPEYFRTAFSNIHERLLNEKTYNCHLSGSTVCAVLFDGLHVYCANAGDSRAVLYSRTKGAAKNQPIVGKLFNATELSEDHKPDLAKERARVEREGGRVHPIVGP